MAPKLKAEDLPNSEEEERIVAKTVDPDDEDALDCYKREKEARIVLEKECNSLREELQRVRDYNFSLQQFNINILNDLKSATDSNLQREREKSEILETSATDSFDEAFRQRVERQVQELTCELVRFKENMMRCTVAEADKLSTLEETCSSQRDQISVLQHQLAAANHKLEASSVLNVDILTLLKFYFHEDFRKTAVSAVPDLLRFSKLAIEAQGCDGTYLKKLSDYIVPAFVEALHKEPDTKIIASMLDALSKCLQIFGPLLDENQVRSIVDEIKQVFTASSSREEERAKRTNAEDFDAELLKEENKQEEQVLTQVGEVLGTLAKALKASFLPFFDELWSYLMPMLGKDKTFEETRIAICIFDDVAQHCCEAALSKPDPFSMLQDDILLDIMSRIDCTTKELIRTTSTISKRWQNLWASLPHLIFQEEEDDVDPYANIQGYISFIDKTINRCPTYPNLKKFKLDTNYKSSLNPEFKSRVNSWIHYAISRNVEELDLRLLDLEGEFTYDDELFFNSSCVTRIKLSWCLLNPPNGMISWERLESLCIYHGTFDEDMLEKILSGSPCLETLKVEDCYGYRRIDITSKSVKNLVFSGYNSDGAIYQFDEAYVDYIQINAPYISSLTIENKLLLRGLALLDVSSLVEVDLDYSIWNELMNGASNEEMFRGLYESLKHVEDITLGDHLWELLSSSSDMSNDDQVENGDQEEESD